MYLFPVHVLRAPFVQAIEEEFVSVLEKIAESHTDAVHALRAKSILQNMGANKKVRKKIQLI